jgi:hypothetical protein
MVDEAPTDGPGPQAQSGWPNRPVPPPEPARPPSAPPPGWAGARPAWAEPAPPSPPPPGDDERPPSRLAGLRDRLGRRGLVVVAAVVGLLAVAVVAVAVVTSGDGGDGAATGPEAVGKGGQSVTAPAPAKGRDVPLLDGRLVVITPEGWEPLEASTDTASIRVNLREASGRELVATVIVTALPGGGSLDPLLTVDGGTPFEVKAAVGLLRATAVAGRGQVLAAIAHGDATFLFSLSAFALDGNGLDAPLLQQLFTEQVVPQLRFP